MGFLSRANKSSQITPSTTVKGQPQTVIAAHTSISGMLQTEGDIRIDGAFEGEIEVLGNLIVGATGRVVANIKATVVHVAGAVKGDVVATETLEISETGKLWGSVTTSALHIEPGGMFRGQSAMQGPDEPVLLEAPSIVR